MSVSPVGFDIGETHEALIRLRKLGFTPADLNRIAESDEVAKLVVDALRGGGELYPVIVDYGLTLEQMIEAGHYDWKNESITSRNFRVKGSGKKELRGQLLDYDKAMSSEAVLADMEKRGLRPATIEELLAFGAKHSEKQLEFPIVELGSSARVSGHRRVAYLDRSRRKRYLSLYWFGHDWPRSCRFLVFSK